MIALLGSVCEIVQIEVILFSRHGTPRVQNTSRTRTGKEIEMIAELAKDYIMIGRRISLASSS
jgi:hypothetical protein